MPDSRCNCCGGKLVDGEFGFVCDHCARGRREWYEDMGALEDRLRDDLALMEGLVGPTMGDASQLYFHTKDGAEHFIEIDRTPETGLSYWIEDKRCTRDDFVALLKEGETCFTHKTD